MSTFIETEGSFPCSQKSVIKFQRTCSLYEASNLNSYSSITVPPTPMYTRCCFSLRVTAWNYTFSSHTNTNIYLHTCLTLLILHLRTRYCIHKIPPLNPTLNTIYEFSLILHICISKIYFKLVLLSMSSSNKWIPYFIHVCYMSWRFQFFRVATRLVSVMVKVKKPTSLLYTRWRYTVKRRYTLALDWDEWWASRPGRSVTRKVPEEEINLLPLTAIEPWYLSLYPSLCIH